MEEERRKKKNKKKRNKQTNKTTESVTIHAGESDSNNLSRITEIAQDKNDRISGTSDTPNSIREDSNTDRDELPSNHTDGEKLAEDDRQYWLDREASYEERIKELQAEKDSQVILDKKIKLLSKEKEECVQKQLADMADQKKELKQLYDDNSALVQNEASLREKLDQLEKEKDVLIHKEVLIQQKIQQLENKMATHLQKEDTLEMKILQLEGERDVWLQKEASLQEKINEMEREMDSRISNEVLIQQKIQQLEAENATHFQKEATLEMRVQQLEGERAPWVREEANLQEKINEIVRERDSWISEEKSTKESIACLEDDNINLRAKVAELEQSRNTLLEETGRLSENISCLQLKINDLENTAAYNNMSTENQATSEDGNHVDASHGLIVEKLVAENSELVEKVNELNSELDQRSVTTSDVSGLGSSTAQSADNLIIMSDLPVQATQNHETGLSPYSTFGANNMVQISESTQSLEDLIIQDQTNGELTNDKGGSIITSSSEIVEVDEIVQIPLEKNDDRETRLATKDDETTGVPITDAPLIGAPFRFMYFVASYVSGQDLIKKNTGK